MSYNLIQKFNYDVTTAEVIRYEGDNNLSFSYAFSVFSTDEKVLLAIQFQEVNNSTKFFENWVIKEGDNQISFTGLTYGEAGTGISYPGVSDYTVNSNLGEKWKDVKIVSIQYNTDLSRIVRLYSIL